MKTLALAACVMTIPVSAFSHEGVHINDAYVRSTNPAVAAVFLELENHASVDCTLQSASTDAAARTELHTNVEEDGVMKMVALESIAIPSGQTHALERGGDHIMLMGLESPLSDGDKVTLTLDFGPCGQETAEAVVDNARQPSDAGAGHAEHGMDHGSMHKAAE